MESKTTVAVVDIIVDRFSKEFPKNYNVREDIDDSGSEIMSRKNGIFHLGALCNKFVSCHPNSINVVYGSRVPINSNESCYFFQHPVKRIILGLNKTWSRKL